MVPDQLKSGVKTACKYDPEFNPFYAELCTHYGVMVIPAPPGEHRDKAKGENGVLNAQRRILATRWRKEDMAHKEYGVTDIFDLLRRAKAKNRQTTLHG